MAHLSDAEKEQRAKDRAAEKLKTAYDKLSERFKSRGELLDKLKGNQRSSSPSAAETILKAEQEKASNDTSSGFSLLKTGAVIGGVIAGVWYYYHSGSK